MTDIIVLKSANYAVIGNERYFRSKYSNKWYNCKVRGTGETWFNYASYTDDEMVAKGATADCKRACDKDWHMCY